MKAIAIIVAVLACLTCFQVGNVRADGYEIRWWFDICTRGANCTCSEISGSIKDRPETKQLKPYQCGGWTYMYVSKPIDMPVCSAMTLKAVCVCYGKQYEITKDVACSNGKAYLNFIYDTSLVLGFNPF